jgi:hypothetical protein
VAGAVLALGGKHVLKGPEMATEITERDRQMARKCLECPVCKTARRKQRGIAFWFVKSVEGNVCPYCKAYEKVYGKKAYEPE